MVQRLPRADLRALVALAAATAAMHLWLVFAWRAPQALVVPQAAPPRRVAVDLRRPTAPRLHSPTDGLDAAVALPPRSHAATVRSPIPLAAPLRAAPAAVRAVVPAAPASAADATDLPSLPVPTYAVQLPPPGEWQYTLTRGSRTGEATLRWVRDGERYEAELVERVGGDPALRWSSRGRVDEHGIAPDRFVDSRHGRSAQAANFRRDVGRITFSGPAVERPLPDGAQDRLSALLQLSGVVAREPARWQAGAALLLYVSGAHGGAELWRFVVQGLDAVDDSGAAQALKLVREPERPYDTRAEVWLDPASHYLPVRLRTTNGAYVQELRLRSSPDSHD